MSDNPYESPAASQPSVPRAVGCFVFVFGTCVMIGSILAIPAIVWISGALQGFTLSGARPHPFEARFAIGSTLVGCALILLGSLSALLGFRNWRANKRADAEGSI